LNPIQKGVEYDMCRLFFAVRQEGGYRAVTFENKWGKVLQKLKWGDQMNSEELRELYHKRLETFEYFQDRMISGGESTASAPKLSTPPKQTPAVVTKPRASPSVVPDRSLRQVLKKTAKVAATTPSGERKRKAPVVVETKKRRISASSPESEGRGKGSSASPQSQKPRVMSPSELDGTDGYVAADM
jgi:hypothetical protein